MAVLSFHCLRIYFWMLLLGRALLPERMRLLDWMLILGRMQIVGRMLLFETMLLRRTVLLLERMLCNNPHNYQWKVVRFFCGNFTVLALWRLPLTVCD